MFSFLQAQGISEQKEQKGSRKALRRGWVRSGRKTHKDTDCLYRCTNSRCRKPRQSARRHSNWPPCASAVWTGEITPGRQPQYSTRHRCNTGREDGLLTKGRVRTWRLLNRNPVSADRIQRTMQWIKRKRSQTEPGWEKESLKSKFLWLLSVSATWHNHSKEDPRYCWLKLTQWLNPPRMARCCSFCDYKEEEETFSWDAMFHRSVRACYKKNTQEGIILCQQQTFEVIWEAIYSNNIHHTIQQTLTQTWFRVEQHLEFRSGSSEVMIWSDTQTALQAPVMWFAVDIFKYTTNTTIIKQAEAWKSFQIRQGVLKIRVITFKTCFQAVPCCLPSAGIDGRHCNPVQGNRMDRCLSTSRLLYIKSKCKFISLT